MSRKCYLLIQKSTGFYTHFSLTYIYFPFIKYSNISIYLHLFINKYIKPNNEIGQPVFKQEILCESNGFVSFKM